MCPVCRMLQHPANRTVNNYDTIRYVRFIGGGDVTKHGVKLIT